MSIPFKIVKLSNSEYNTIYKVLNLSPLAFNSNNLIACIDKEVIGTHTYALIHYNPNKITEIMKSPYSNDILKIRGYIINLTMKKIVCKSYSYPEEIISDELPKYIPNHPESEGNVQWTKFYNGVLIRLWKDQDKVMFSTHKKINALNSYFDEKDNKFYNFFINNQSVFTLDNFPCIQNEVHLFLVTDNKLLVEARYESCSNSVIYLESFSLKQNASEKDSENVTMKMKTIIEHENETALKKILFQYPVDYDEANEWFQYGPVKTSYSDEYQRFQSGEKIIMTYNGKKYTCIPNSLIERRNIIDGNCNQYKLFCDFLIKVMNGHSVFPHYYSYDDLVDMNKYVQLQEEIPQDLLDNKYDSEDNVYLTTLTNLFFLVPTTRIDDLMKAYLKFNTNIINTVEFLYKHIGELFELADQNKLREFPSLHTGGAALINEITRLGSYKFTILNTVPKYMEQCDAVYFWDRFFDAVHSGDDKLFNEYTFKIKLFMFIISSESLYAFLNFETKYNNTMKAWEKSKLQSTVEIMEFDEKPSNGRL